MSRLRTLTFKTLRILVIAYIGILLMMYFGQRQFLFITRISGPETPKEAGLNGYTQAFFTADDGLSIPFWYHPSDDANAPLLLYFHGNAGGLYQFTWALERFADQGYAVAGMEYRGFSGALGKPSEQAIIADAITFAKHMVAENPHRPIVLWGYSLGTGVATQLAATIKEDSVLILEAPFTSTVNLASEMYPYLPVHWLMHDRFDSIGHIGDIDAALYIMHGRDDTLVPAAHAKLVYDAAKAPKKRTTFSHYDHFNLIESKAYDTAFAYIAQHTAVNH